MWLFRRRRRFRPTVGRLITDIILPGIVVIYFVATEKEFIEQFNKDFPIMLMGEVFFLSIHVALTYFLLPLVWLIELLIFIGAGVPGITIQRDIFSLYSKVLFSFLIFMTFLRFVVPLFS